jgi:hypothetical protein
MSQEDTADAADRHTSLNKSERGSAATIKQQPRSSRFDQSAGTELLEVHGRPHPGP